VVCPCDVGHCELFVAVRARVWRAESCPVVAPPARLPSLRRRVGRRASVSVRVARARVRVLTETVPRV
jgi:hypothetical protein